MSRSIFFQRIHFFCFVILLQLLLIRLLQFIYQQPPKLCQLCRNPYKPVSNHMPSYIYTYIYITYCLHAYLHIFIYLHFIFTVVCLLNLIVNKNLPCGKFVLQTNKFASLLLREIFAFLSFFFCLFYITYYYDIGFFIFHYCHCSVRFFVLIAAHKAPVA